MSIWGKVIGGMAGFALGGPLGALLGAFAGHAVDRMRTGGTASAEDRRLAFTIAVIVLSAKMAKADGHVSRDEIAAFKRVFHIPPDEMEDVGRLFDEARQDASGFEPYAEQIARLFAGEPALLEELLGSLFHIAMADGHLHREELDYLRRVAAIFGFDARVFERIRASLGESEDENPYTVLGLAPGATDAELKRVYRNLSRENHPDTLIAQGMPQEFVDLANGKMAAINAAHDRIRKERGLA
ncbi:MAG: TerB family tellurite resistance protein [Rhodospirillales bacterium]|jgi:DnaJ like chaperone protein|nr:TerB family tellurite resistance protein [Rhodospirillales bacterium]HJO97636.1 TerB family tellurite resistance protein [Rhodospirillales bacterium]